MAFFNKKREKSSAKTAAPSQKQKLTFHNSLCIEAASYHLLACLNACRFSVASMPNTSASFFVGFVVAGPLCGRPQPSHYMRITQI